MCKLNLIRPEKIFKPHDYIPLPRPNLNIFHYKGGRKYMSSSSIVSIDDKEFNRIQLQHIIYYNVWENHFSAPVHDLLSTEGTKVLDVG
jgi:hypothetical protein